jgi:hypothetical protein
MWSGRRGSNSRHSAWEADALPTELLPRCRRIYHSLRKPSTSAHGKRKPRLNSRGAVLWGLVEVEGFEPTTPRLQSGCSPSELHPQARGDYQGNPCWSSPFHGWRKLEVFFAPVAAVTEAGFFVGLGRTRSSGRITLLSAALMSVNACGVSSRVMRLRLESFMYT